MTAPAKKKGTGSLLTRSPRTALPKGTPAGGKFRVRMVVIFSGAVFKVPQGIQRIDSKSTHGWQVRLHGTRMFSDHTSDGSGARASLRLAVKELLARIASQPAPVSLQRGPSSNKRSDLPPGISGPIVRARAGSNALSASLSVLLPRFGDKPRVRSLYIGSEANYTRARFRAALAQAIALRDAALAAYMADATQARRKAARELKSLLAD